MIERARILRVYRHKRPSIWKRWGGKHMKSWYDSREEGPRIIYGTYIRIRQ